LGSHFLITASFGILFIYRIKELLALGFCQKKELKKPCVLLGEGPE
jgi:hypothetical protein